MTTTFDAFDGYRRSGVTRFVQSAIVIDNEAEFSSRKSAARPQKPATRPPVSRLRVKTPAAIAKPAEPEPKPVVVEETSQELDAKSLTDAWSDREVICGLYRPEPGEGENMVVRAQKAALHADVVILDWFLEKSSSVRAKEIVREILKADLASNGRLRLLAIYTSQTGVTAIAKEVLDAVEDEPSLKNLLTLDGAVLSGANIRICVLSKPQTMGTSDVDKVDESNLPGRLIDEFAELSKGLLTSFALHSIAAVRRAAHHLVTVFQHDLDGAFLGHRCALEQPDDSREFAVELLLGELRNVIAVDEAIGGHMADDILDAWVDQRATDGFVSQGKAVSPNVVKALLKGGTGAVATGQFFTSADGKPAKGAVRAENMGRLFFSDDEAAWKGHLELSRVANFKREAFGRTQLPSGFRPMLTLGSVLKSLGPMNESETALYAGLTDEFYVCMQPRCDSVRLEGDVSFPFQTAKASGEVFNLVVKERGQNTGTPVLVGSKLSTVVVISFPRDETSKTVRAVEQDDGFVFTDTLGRKFIWLGDLRDMKAQQDASALAATLHRVGLDQLEWLRLASSKNSSSDFKPQPAAEAAADD